MTDVHGKIEELARRFEANIDHFRTEEATKTGFW